MILGAGGFRSAEGWCSHGLVLSEKVLLSPGFKFVFRYIFARVLKSNLMTTSKKTASQAGKDLRDPKTPKKDRGPIASDLAQAKRPKR
jgi:hypothetical protein